MSLVSRANEEINSTISRDGLGIASPQQIAFREADDFEPRARPADDSFRQAEALVFMTGPAIGKDADELGNFAHARENLEALRRNSSGEAVT